MLNSSEPVLKSYRRSNRSDMTADALLEAILGDQGIYAQLEGRWDAYKAHALWHKQGFMDDKRGEEPHFVDESGNKRPGNEALSPSPLINTSLTQLVEYCIGAYQEGTVKEFFEKAASDPKYRRRMAELPALTGAAEAAMEKYYAKVALERITVPEAGNGHITLSEEAIDTIKTSAEKRLAEYLGRNHVTFHWEGEGHARRVVADQEKDKRQIAQVRRILRLDETIHPFPYAHNYEHIAYGEKHLLTDPHTHKNFPLSLLQEQQKDMLRGKTPEEAAQIKEEHPETFGVQDLENKYMTFVGSGALPLTGLMNHIISGCKINLIDSDPEAADISRTFITYLELLGVLEKDAVKVYREDGANVYYGGPHGDLERADYAGETWENAKHLEWNGEAVEQTHRDKLYVPTDILYVAGLIPNADKQTIMLNLEDNKKDPVRSIMVRSARGVSRLLYEPIQNHVFFQSPYYDPHGTLVPERNILPYVSPSLACEEDATTQACVSAVLSDDNVNTARLFHRSSLPLANAEILFEEGSLMALEIEKELGHKPDFSHIDWLRARKPIATSRDV